MAKDKSAGENPMRVTILGAGHGGLATAAHLALKGHAVTLFSFFSNELTPVVEQGGIRVQGDVEGFAPSVQVATSINDAVKAAELIMLISPALSHRTYASLLSGCLHNGQLLLLSPGRTGGALEFAGVMKRYAVKAKFILAEAQTFMYATESRGPAHVEIMKEKDVMRVAALPACLTDEVVETLRRIYPQIEPAENVLETSLNNVGGIVHPAPMLLNTCKLDEAAAGADHRYYRDVITRTICETVMEKMDAEKVAVGQALGLADVWTTKTWYERSYGISGETLYDVLQNNHYYAGFHAPKHYLAYHHVLDEVPNTLVPIASFGTALQVPTPTIDAIIALASAMVGVDFRREGRTVEKLGLAGLDAPGMMRYVA